MRLPLAIACVALLSACASEPPPPPPNVIIWMVDTLRADHVGAYGYERDTSPVMDSLAEGGVLFEELHAHSNWTQPSVASLMSGRYPPLFTADFMAKCPEDYMMAAEWFSYEGYITTGFTMTIASAEMYGFAQGFDEYLELQGGRKFKEQARRTGTDFDAHHLVNAANTWIDERPADDPPFFMYLHSVDPHAPYEPHEDGKSFGAPYNGRIDGSIDVLTRALKRDYNFTPEDIQYILDLYDGEVHYNDAQLGRLIEKLEETGLRENTLIVIVSDHGEEFWDHGTHGHGHRNVFRELTHVPFILNWPAGLPAGKRVDGLLRGMDVLPTILDLIDLPPIEGGIGRSAAGSIHGDEPLPESPVMLDRAKEQIDLAGVRSKETLFIDDPKDGSTRLFDHIADPAELEDISAANPEVIEPLREIVDSWRTDREAMETVDAGEMDEATRQRLEALGYLDKEVEDR